VQVWKRHLKLLRRPSVLKRVTVHLTPELQQMFKTPFTQTQPLETPIRQIQTRQHSTSALTIAGCFKCECKCAGKFPSKKFPILGVGTSPVTSSIIYVYPSSYGDMRHLEINSEGHEQKGLGKIRPGAKLFTRSAAGHWHGVGVL